MSSLTHPAPSILGGILLVIGNVIGAGILALPIATAQLGLTLALVLIIGFWLLMMLSAFYYLEANMAFPSGSNLISMTFAGLGKWGVGIAWICNLTVMYSLISAYISGGGDLIKINFNYLNLELPSFIAPILFLFLFGSIVSSGIRLTDQTNRILMLAKAVIFFVILYGLSSHAQLDTIPFLQQGNLSTSLLIIVITSFGFAVIIPSLRTYYHSDLKKIKRIIFLGTFIPLICYITWITLIFSVIPYDGVNGLKQMSNSSHPVSDLQSVLSVSLHQSWITQSINLFSSICIITSFFANSISLNDFLFDGLRLNKKTSNCLIVSFIAYAPPLLAVLYYPKAFLLGLSIAGIFAIIQLLILPGLIVWSVRYSNHLYPSNYSVVGGKPLLALLITVGLILLIITTQEFL